MGRRKTQRIPQEFIQVSLDSHTGRMVKAWKKKGANISEMIRFCMTQTFPVITTPNDEIKQLKELMGFHNQKFEQTRNDYERKLVALQIKINKIELRAEQNDMEKKPITSPWEKLPGGK